MGNLRGQILGKICRQKPAGSFDVGLVAVFFLKKRNICDFEGKKLFFCWFLFPKKYIYSVNG